MNKYFVEFEFETNMNNKYWFPIFIETESIDRAMEVSKRIKAAIKDNYSLNKFSEPKIYSTSPNSEFIESYINNGFRGEIKTLELNNWKFKDLNQIENISFDKNLKLFSTYGFDNLEDNTIANTISRHKFPVKIIRADQDYKEVDEFLLVNLVSPKFVNKLIGAFKNRRV